MTAAQSRLHTIEELENSLEGHVPGTRAVVEAWQRGELRGIEDIVSNLVTTQERYAHAMDVAFGARLSNVVTTTSEDAERCVEFLNRKLAGRATFCRSIRCRIAKDVRSIRSWPTCPALSVTRTRCSRPATYAGIVSFLVGSVLMVDELQTGIELVRARGVRDTIVTLGGEQITGGGAITGGRFARERSILSRRFSAQSYAKRLPVCAPNSKRRIAHCGRARRAEAAIEERDAAPRAAGCARRQKLAALAGAGRGDRRPKSARTQGELQDRARRRRGAAAANRGACAIGRT